MKRTEIIIETRRVTVIQHRNRSTDVFSDEFPGDLKTTKQTDTGQHEIANDVIPGEENERCTDSRDH
jgi:hypothetical protein